jgi:hypothetical protein
MLLCNSWNGVSFLVSDVYHRCHAKVLDITLLLLSVEQSEESQRLGDMYEQHDNAACDIC